MISVKTGRFLTLAFCLMAAVFFSTAGMAEEPKLSTGQTLYVASYSTVFLGGKAIELPLAATLVVRNIDPQNTIRLKSIKYYGSQGQMLKNYLPTPLSLTPLGSRRFPVQEEKDHKAVQDGACFLVKWESSRPVNTPVVECLMIGSAGQQGISFVSSGVAIQPAK